ncbi:MAG: hypothetical protein ABJE95_04140 [Byssovorax sp.]
MEAVARERSDRLETLVNRRSVEPSHVTRLAVFEQAHRRRVGRCAFEQTPVSVGRPFGAGSVLLRGADILRALRLTAVENLLEVQIAKGLFFRLGRRREWVTSDTHRARRVARDARQRVLEERQCRGFEAPRPQRGQDVVECSAQRRCDLHRLGIIGGEHHGRRHRPPEHLRERCRVGRRSLRGVCAAVQGSNEQPAAWAVVESKGGRQRFHNICLELIEPE